MCVYVLQLYKFTKALQADLETAGIRGKEGNWYSSKVMIPSNARIIDFVVSDKDLQARLLVSILLHHALLFWMRVSGNCALCACIAHLEVYLVYLVCCYQACFRTVNNVTSPPAILHSLPCILISKSLLLHIQIYTTSECALEQKCVVHSEESSAATNVRDAVCDDMRLWVQVWDNNHHRDYHSRVSSGKDQATLEEEAYRQLLSNSLDSDTEAAQRAGVHHCLLVQPTIAPFILVAVGVASSIC